MRIRDTHEESGKLVAVGTPEQIYNRICAVLQAKRQEGRVATLSLPGKKLWLQFVYSGRDDAKRQARHYRTSESANPESVQEQEHIEATAASIEAKEKREGRITLFAEDPRQVNPDDLKPLLVISMTPAEDKVSYSPQGGLGDLANKISAVVNERGRFSGLKTFLEL